MVDSTSLHPQVKKLCLSSLVCKDARIPLFIFWTFELEAETEGNVLVTQCWFKFKMNSDLQKNLMKVFMLVAKSETFANNNSGRFQKIVLENKHI